MFDTMHNEYKLPIMLRAYLLVDFRRTERTSEWKAEKKLTENDRLLE